MHRVLLQPPFIALADGLDNRWTPASGEPHVKGVHHHNAPETDRRDVSDDVISVSDSEVDQESSLGEESSFACGSSASEGKDSSDSEPAMSKVSDQCSMLEHAFQSVRNVFSTTSEGKLVGGDGSLNQLESLPGHWPFS